MISKLKTIKIRQNGIDDINLCYYQSLANSVSWIFTYKKFHSDLIRE